MDNIFGERLKKAMEIRNLSVSELTLRCEPLFKAEGYSIFKQDIYKYLKGLANPTFDRLALIAKTLDVNIWWLLGAPEESNMNDEEIRLIKAWRRATISERENVAFMLRNYGMELSEPKIIKKKEA